jgi:autotransporter-associated beta strand protein
MPFQGIYAFRKICRNFRKITLPIFRIFFKNFDRTPEHPSQPPMPPKVDPYATSMQRRIDALQTVTFGSGLSSSGGTFAKSGSGTLIFGANNAYSGTTTINGGTLQIGSGSTAGSLGTGSIIDNAALTFNRSDNVSVSNSISGTGSVSQLAASTLALTGNNSYTGATSIGAGGTISAGGLHAIGSNATNGVTINSTGTLLLSGSTGVNDRIADAARVSMTGGSIFNTGKLTEGVVPTGPTGSGGSAGMGALSLTGNSAAFGDRIVINFATLSTDPSSALAFSSLIGGSGKFVDILNWTGQLGFDDGNSNNDRLLFASDPALSQTDLANFNFYSDGGSTLFAAGGTEFVYGNMFEIVAVPEPGTWVAAALSLLTIAYSQRRRVMRAVKRVRC